MLAVLRPFQGQRQPAETHEGVDVDIPLGVLSAITGVAGSGKSSLLACLPEDVAKRMLFTGQTPIKGSRRSNPATYTGALDAIRKAFAKANSTPDNTVKPALFSANSEGRARTAMAPALSTWSSASWTASTCPARCARAAA